MLSPVGLSNLFRPKIKKKDLDTILPNIGPETEMEQVIFLLEDVVPKISSNVSLSALVAEKL